MDAWLETYICDIVDHPDDVRVETEQGMKVMLYKVFVNKKDVGMVLGRKKRTLEALNKIFELAGRHTRMRHVVKVID